MNHSEYRSLLSDCTLCPRKCHVNRPEGQTGICGQSSTVYVARAALHFWEEPCISGVQGSGAVFFSGCNLRCIYCQNYSIAHTGHGYPVTIEQLSELYLSLQDQGAANINLVTGTHFIPQIRESLILARQSGLHLPIVYNSSGYEEVESLKLLAGHVDVYLPDLKYIDSSLSLRLSHAPDYFEKASLAISEMYRQVQDPIFDPATGLMKKGLLIRHLLLPGQGKNTKKVLRYLHNTYGDHIYISIMNQYTPMEQLHLPEYKGCFQDIARTVTADEYDKILDFADRIGITNGFIQEGSAAGDSFIPSFSGEGVPDIPSNR